jgi:hypothetical protein
MEDDLIVFEGLVDAPVVGLEATADIAPLTEVVRISAERRTLSQTASSSWCRSWSVKLTITGSSSTQVNAGVSSSGSLRIG